MQISCRDTTRSERLLPPTSHRIMIMYAGGCAWRRRSFLASPSVWGKQLNRRHSTRTTPKLRCLQRDDNTFLQHLDNNLDSCGQERRRSKYREFLKRIPSEMYDATICMMTGNMKYFPMWDDRHAQSYPFIYHRDKIKASIFSGIRNLLRFHEYISSKM